MTLRLEAPRPPEQPAPFRFPVIATVAPVVVAVIIWVATGSAFALIFAALGPVTAIATWVDSRVGARKIRRSEAARFEHEYSSALGEISRRHNAERAHLSERAPDAPDIMHRRGADPYRWTATLAAGLPIAIGRGTVRSALESEPPSGALGPESEARLRQLAARAMWLEHAPLLIDATLGIGICGPRALAEAVARALVVQLAWALSPAEHRWSGDAAAELEWLSELPHEHAALRTRGAWVEFGDPAFGAGVVVAVADTPAELPGACRVVVRLGAGGGEIVQHPEPAMRGAVHPVAVSREQALEWARRASRDAAREGLAAPHAELPAAAELAPLLRPQAGEALGATAGNTTLACEFAVGAAGPITLDLAVHGPHAVVGGTTGSGKSELLIAWVIAMAAPRPPSEVTFLLVDFKGGSAFAALGALPHVVGTITDLDASGAARALESLRAEVRYRERLLVREGARSIEQTSSLPRLVIVVDEFAAMLADHPDLHALFADLAARGRSLGIHLVLCTQRPSGVVRDGVLANADLRVSLRVNNRSDSFAVVGTDAAATIPLQARGRGILRLAGGEPQLVQCALATEADVAEVAARWSLSPAPRRPWCEPLPEVVPLAALASVADGIAFGVVDLPHEQRQETAVYRPDNDGHLLVLGAPASGKSVALEALARGGSRVVWIPPHADAAWDVLGDLVDALERQQEPQPVLTVLDDLDALIPRFSGDHRAAFVESLGRVLRDGPGRGIRFVMSAQRVTGEVQSLAALAPSRLFLRHSSRQEFVIAGGEGAQFLDGLPAGGGLWRGYRVQVASVPPAHRTVPLAREVSLDPRRPLAIVTSRAAMVLANIPGAVSLADAVPELRTATATIVGDIDDWQSRWGALAALRTTTEIVFDRCTPADFRALTRSRQLPPPLSPRGGQGWRLNDDGSASRARIPGLS